MDQPRYPRKRTRTRRNPNKGTNKCTECTGAIFDETWGEYKCRVKQRRIKNPNDYTDCKDFVKDKTK